MSEKIKCCMFPRQAPNKKNYVRLGWTSESNDYNQKLPQNRFSRQGGARRVDARQPKDTHPARDVSGGRGGGIRPAGKATSPHCLLSVDCAHGGM